MISANFAQFVRMSDWLHDVPTCSLRVGLVRRANADAPPRVTASVELGYCNAAVTRTPENDISPGYGSV